MSSALSSPPSPSLLFSLSAFTMPASAPLPTFLPLSSLIDAMKKLNGLKPLQGTFPLSALPGEQHHCQQQHLLNGWKVRRRRILRSPKEAQMKRESGREGHECERKDCCTITRVVSRRARSSQGEATKMVEMKGGQKTPSPSYRNQGSNRVVLQALAHLLAITGQHQAVAHQVLKSRFIKEGRGQHHERVEPAPRLIQAYTAEPHPVTLPVTLNTEMGTGTISGLLARSLSS